MRMKTRGAFVVLAAIAATTSRAAGCPASLQMEIQAAQHMVSSLHADKPAQMRVYAFDGAEYSAGEARWLQAQLRITERACDKSDETGVQFAFEAVERVLKSHHELG